MTDGAVLAHHIFILEDDAGAGPVVRTGVRPADQIDDLVGLDAARSRIDRIGSDAGQIVDLECGDRAVAFDADFCFDAMIARMDVGDETFETVGDEFNRPLQEFRQRRRRHLVGIDMHLDAERAADVLRQDAHLIFFEIEMLGEQVLHHVRRLRALIDGEAPLARIPVGDDGARLVGDAGMAAEHECRLDHDVGGGKTLVRFAGIERPLKGEIVAKLGMDHRRFCVERRFRIGDARQNFVIHPDQGASVLRFGAGAGDHGAHRLALPAGALDRDGVLRRRFDSFEMREHADPGRDHLGKLGAGDDRDDAGRLLGFRSLDIFDAGMGMRRTHECDMRHARQRNVGDVLAAPLGEPRQIGPRHRTADIGIRPVERGEARRLVERDFHFPSVIPGPSEARSPESIFADLWVWIPGSRAEARVPE